MPDTLLEHLRRVVGDAHVLADADTRAGYETDWTGRFRGEARVVVRPGSTAEVAAVAEACRSAGAAIVPQGGNTGLVGGGVPRDGEVVVSTRRLDGLDPVDEATGQLTVGAGVTLAAVAEHVRGAGLDPGVDLAARDSATVGGMVATNAGGVRVVRHGMMRTRVAGLEAVLADASVVTRLHGLAKDNTGYDLTQLLVGSEGTLGVVTRVRLRLVPLLPQRVTAIVGLPDLAAAVDLLPALRTHAPSLEAVEYVDATTLDLVRAHADLPAPLGADHPVHVLVELAGRSDPTDELAAVLGDHAHVAVGTERRDREGLWAYREGATEAINASGVPRKLDVTVPAAALPTFAEAAHEAVAEAAPRARLALFGHLADGNAHVNLLGLGEAGDRVDEAILHLVAALGGSVSAEHGIGVAKARWLHLSRSAAELKAMRAIKAALDPEWLLNPGVLLDR